VLLSYPPNFSDSHGAVVPNGAYPVNFLVSGAGELTGVANGNPHNVDSFTRPHHYTWHGQAQAILRPAKQPGSLRLIAQAPGLRPAMLKLAVAPER
jgi:beta-galactosidase